MKCFVYFTHKANMSYGRSSERTQDLLMSWSVVRILISDQQAKKTNWLCGAASG